MLFLLTAGLDEKEKNEITKIYYDYKSIMKFFALKYVTNESDAEDIVHDAFFKIKKNLTKIISLSCKKKQSYIVNIVKTTSIEYLRKEKRAARNLEIYSKELDNAKESDTVQNYFNQEELRLGIERVMHQIDDKYMVPLIMKYYHGYSIKEICIKLSIESENTVASLIHRGKKKFIEVYLNSGEWSA
jgi:RNA polymerase sigma-70 factor (ECF subfamily)